MMVALKPRVPPVGAPAAPEDDHRAPGCERYLH